MGAIFADSHNYLWADVASKYTQTTVGAAGSDTSTVVTSGGPFNRSYIKLANAGNNAATVFIRCVPSTPVPSGGRFIMGYWIRVVSTFAITGATQTDESRAVVFSVRQFGTTHVWVRLNTNGTLSLYRGSTLLGTTAAALFQNVWHHVELNTLIHASAGTADLAIDGMTSAGFALTGLNTLGSTSAAWDEFRFGGYFAAIGSAAEEVDVSMPFVLDGSGSQCNTRLGPARVDAQAPTSDGNYTAWTLSTGSSHFAVVDEAQGNGDTDYASTATAGNKESYNHAALVASAATIVFVQLDAQVKREDAGAAGVKGLWRRAGTDYLSAEQGVPLSYAHNRFIYELDPSTGAAWTESNFNSAEIGLQKST